MWYNTSETMIKSSKWTYLINFDQWGMKMSELSQEIENLEEQETKILADLIAAETEEDERNITNDLNIVRNKLSEKKEELKALQEKEQQRAEVIEEKVHAEAVPFAIAGVDLGGIPVEVVQWMEEVVKVDRRRIYNEHAIELEQAEEVADQARQAMEDKIYELLESEGNLKEERIKLGDQLHQEQMMREDAEQKRDAAVREKEEREEALTALIRLRDNEIERLNAQVEEYQRAKVWDERQAQQIIDTTPEEQTTLQERTEAVKKLFSAVEDWGSRIQVFKPEGGFEIVKRDEFEAEWTPVVPELPSFHGESETTAAESQDTGVQAPEVAEAVESFPDEEQTDIVMAGLGDTEAGEEVTRAEFEALKRRVDKIDARSSAPIQIGPGGDPVSGEAA